MKKLKVSISCESSAVSEALVVVIEALDRRAIQIDWEEED